MCEDFVFVLNIAASTMKLSFFYLGYMLSKYNIEHGKKTTFPSLS